MTLEPDWSLIRFISRTVADPKWGGGVSREHLAELTRLPAHGHALSEALAIAGRLRRIDFCRNYVVVPGRPSPANRPTLLTERTVT